MSVRRRPRVSSQLGGLCLALVSTSCAVDDVVAARLDGSVSLGDASPVDLGPLEGEGLLPLPPPFGPEGPRMCSCAGLSLGASLVADGDVAADGDLAFNDALSVTGQLSVAAEVRGGGGDAALGALRVGGPWTSMGLLEVTGDAELAGNLQVDRLIVRGRLRQPGDATRDVSGDETVGTIESGAVTVLEPCGCGALPEVGSWIDGLGPWPGSDGPPNNASLSSGRFTFDPPAAGSDTTLSVEGNAWVRLEGRLALSTLTVRFLGDEDALLIIVDGALELSNLIVQGTGALAFVSNHDGSIRLPEQPPAVPVQIWAPRAELLVPNQLSWNGQILVSRLAAAGPVDLR